MVKLNVLIYKRSFFPVQGLSLIIFNHLQSMELLAVIPILQKKMNQTKYIVSIPSCPETQRSQKSLFSLLVIPQSNLYVILITISFPFRFSICVQSELMTVNSTNPVAEKSHVNMTATARQLTVMPGTASLWTLKHTRKNEASTFQKISEQT